MYPLPFGSEYIQQQTSDDLGLRQYIWHIHLLTMVYILHIQTLAQYQTAVVETNCLIMLGNNCSVWATVMEKCVNSCTSVLLKSLILSEFHQQTPHKDQLCMCKQLTLAGSHLVATRHPPHSVVVPSTLISSRVSASSPSSNSTFSSCTLSAVAYFFLISCTIATHTYHNTY